MTSKLKKSRRKQWGAEKRTEPLSIIHDRPSTLKIAFSRLAIVFTIVFWFLYLISTVFREFFEDSSYRFTLEAISYLIVVTFLTFSALMYLIMRQGALQNFYKHVRVPRVELDRFFYTKRPTMTVLVPSYGEEVQVIRKTLLSAALQEYPHLKVVLLIDDNPNPKKEKETIRLEETRKIANELMDLLKEPRDKFSKQLKKFEKNMPKTKYLSIKRVEELAEDYIWAASGLEKLANIEVIEDHVDRFFANQVLKDLAHELSLTAEALQESTREGSVIETERGHQLYQRLSWIFDAKIEVFERKKYASLSHEANKAMNLNSYIGLMGNSYKQVETAYGHTLIATNEKSKDNVVFEDSDYLLTLDADSILLREYCLRLVYFLEQPNNSSVAVTQTPYSSFRGSDTRIERLASATTDIQHILHQGMSYYGATFWVGANAVIRKRALEDIAETEWIGGFEIKRYIQDRTVIEDTESSVDLALKGWTLANYPERLSYSATPPDFGSLVIQRRRWANGGLIIAPKLFNYIKDRKRQNQRVSKVEILLRLNYMASIAWSSFGLIFLLAFPYDSRLLSPLVLLAAAPYFLCMASDLKYSGYKRLDVLRIYGFNLILLPVNLSGVLKSIQQSITNKKIPFARTPKVKNRTLSPLIYVLAPQLIIAISVYIMIKDIRAENWMNAAFAGFNAITATWAYLAYIGIWNSVVDIWHGLTKWLYVDIKQNDQNTKNSQPEGLDWQAILYHGNSSGSVPLAAHSKMIYELKNSTKGSKNVRK